MRTKAEKKEYFKTLREGWKQAKRMLALGKLTEIEAIIANHGMNVSATGFMFVRIQMEQLGYDGLPYLDAKTYKGWIDSGFRVKKGEHSNLNGITWIGASKGEGDNKEDFMFPKQYNLFHRTQVEAIA